MFLAVASPVFEGMFFGPLADKGLREVKIGSTFYYTFVTTTHDAMHH